MAQYVVLEPSDSKDAEKAIFVRDGFHVLALVLPFVWLLTQRLWFEAFAVLGISILLGLVGTYFGIADVIPFLTLLVSLFVALEGVNWRISKLKRQGFVEKAVIDASDLDEAEVRYFYGLEEADQPAMVLTTVSAQTPAPEWAQKAPRPTYSSLGSTIGLVGHRGEN